MAEPTGEVKRNYWVLIASMVSLQVTSSTIYMGAARLLLELRHDQARLNE